jgi:hypothetical protein
MQSTILSLPVLYGFSAHWKGRVRVRMYSMYWLFPSHSSFSSVSPGPTAEPIEFTWELEYRKF